MAVITENDIINYGITCGYDIDLYLSYLQYQQKNLSEQEWSFEGYMITKQHSNRNNIQLFKDFSQWMGYGDPDNVPPCSSFKKYCAKYDRYPYDRQETYCMYEENHKSSAFVMGTADRGIVMRIIRDEQDLYRLSANYTSKHRQRLQGVVLQVSAGEELDKVLTTMYAQGGDKIIIDNPDDIQETLELKKDPKGHALVFRSPAFKESATVSFMFFTLDGQNFLKTMYNVLNEQYNNQNQGKQIVKQNPINQ